MGVVSGQGRIAGGALTAIGAASFAVSVTAVPVYYSAGGGVETVLVARYGLILAISLLLVTLRRAPLSLQRPQLLAALGSGIVFGGGGLCAIGAYALLPVSLGVLIFYIFPLLTAVLEAPLDRRPPPLAQVLCLAAALTGIALALELGQVEADPLGIAMSALGALGVAISFVWSGRALGGVHPGTVNVFRSAAALALALGFGIGVGNGLLRDVGPLAWAAFAISVATSVVAFMAMFAGVQRIGATPAAMIMNLEPVIASALAVLVLSETLTPMKLAGGAIVIAAVLVSQLLGMRTTEGRPPGRVPRSMAPRGPQAAAASVTAPAHHSVTIRRQSRNPGL